MTNIKPGDELDFGDVSWVVLRVYPAEVKIGIYVGDRLVRKTSMRMSTFQQFLDEGQAVNPTEAAPLPMES